MLMRVQWEVLEEACLDLHLQFVSFSSPCDGILNTVDHAGGEMPVGLILAQPLVITVEN